MTLTSAPRCMHCPSLRGTSEAEGVIVIVNVNVNVKNAVFIMQVSLFNGFADKNPKPITIREVVEIIRADQRLQVLTENHRRYRAAGDTVRAEAEKQHMPCYSVAMLFSGGKQQKHIVGYTGMSIVDLDHIPKENIPSVLEKVRGDEHTLLAYTTISGEGVRILARYVSNDNVNDNDNCLPDGKSTSTLTSTFSNYKHAFAQINTYYSTLTGCDYDEKCKNATRISGMAHDPEVYYNPDAVPIVVDMTKKPVGRPKRVEILKMTVESCEAAVLRELERRGVVYEAGNHNKYISDACYMMNRYGVSESDCTAWALDKFADYQAEGNDVASIVRSCYLQTEEHGTARPPRAAESRYASIKDIQDWLTENNIRIRHNLITRKREMVPLCSQAKLLDADKSTAVATDARTASAPQGGKTPTSMTELLPLGGGWEGATELTDQHVNSLYCRFCLDTGRQAKISDFYIIIESDFYPDYHPLKEYLESLPAWDGTTDHIDRLASTVHVTGCTQELHNRFFK